MIKLPANTPKELLKQIATQVKDKNHFRSDGSGGYEVSEQVYNQIKQHIPKQQTSAPTQQQTSAPKSTQSNEEDSTFPFNTPGFLLMALIFLVMFGAKKGCFKDVSISDVFTKEARDDRPGRQPQNVYILPVDGIKGGVDVVETYDRQSDAVTISVNGTQLSVHSAVCNPNIPKVLSTETKGNTVTVVFSTATDQCVSCRVKINSNTGEVKRKGGELHCIR